MVVKKSQEDLKIGTHELRIFLNCSTHACLIICRVQTKREVQETEF